MSREPVFVTRKYPPSVGGMETLAAGVWRSLHRARPKAHLIAHGGPNSSLPLWFPRAVGRLLWLIVQGRVEIVLTGDALAYTLVYPLLRLFRVPHSTMVMGLDVTFDNRLYRAVVHRALRRADGVLAISGATADKAVQFGVPSDRVTVIRLGVDVPEAAPDARHRARLATHRRLGLGADEAVMLTLGRLVRRKGAQWFVTEVLPRLPQTAHYVLAGDGPEADAVAAAAARAGVASRVHLLGRVDDDDREMLMRGADLFVQPNIAVPGDMEGFGLVTIEAALRGTLVVAADLEGIKDAVVSGHTGLLLPSEDAQAWIRCLIDLMASPENELSEMGRECQAAAAGLYGEDAMGGALVLALDQARAVSR